MEKRLEASAKSQQWLINVTRKAFLIMNFGTSLCLYDPAIDFDNKNPVKASTKVHSCGNYAEYLISFDVVNQKLVKTALLLNLQMFKGQQKND